MKLSDIKSYPITISLTREQVAALRYWYEVAAQFDEASEAGGTDLIKVMDILADAAVNQTDVPTPWKESVK